MKNSMRVSPHSIAAEQSVLGGLMMSNKSWLLIDGAVSVDDFYRYDHRLIFRALSEMAGDNKPLDVVTVSDWMAGKSTNRNGGAGSTFLEDAGGMSYLMTLSKDTPSAANIEHYAKTVRNYSIKRQMIEVAVEVMEESYKEGSDDDVVKRLLEKAATKVFEIEQKNESKNKGFVHVKTAVKDKLDAIQQIIDNKEQSILGAASGLGLLDEKLSGFENGKVYVIAGRPGMGKTTLGLNIIEGIASQGKGAVPFFSLEMPADQVVEKLIASQGGVNFGHIRNPKLLEDNDWGFIGSGLKKISNMDLYIDDSSTASPAQLRTRCRRLVRETGNPLSAILIDYVQLMQGSGDRRFPNRAEEIASISNEIRALAKDFNCPVLLLSQLNRSLESRPNKRPVMSDLRESGALEQDASTIIFIYRDEVYNEDTPEKGVAELIIGKQRSGTIGTVRCTFQGQYQRFKDYAYEYDGGQY